MLIPAVPFLDEIQKNRIDSTRFTDSRKVMEKLFFQLFFHVVR